MTVSAPLFDSKVITLADPADLAADPAIMPDDPATGVGWKAQGVFVQIIEGSARWRLGGTEPASDAEGHPLASGEGIVGTVRRGRSWWIWGIEAGTKIAVNPGEELPARVVPRVR